ncbi:MAG: sigma-70 family RNA polymerase sigma factor, partial [Planctomycetes bacterium]|nr:sigma-70 family RNA polymerase sigma factor [Planctomycetota bacterium]
MIGRWIERVGQGGDPAAMGELFDLTAPDLYRLALRLTGNPTDAEDALQETFLAVMRGARSFDPAQRAGPWLTTIVAHEVDRIRRRRTTSPLEHDIARPADDASDRREEWAQARAAIERLPERYRRVLVLRFEHGLTPAKIGEALGVRASTVRSLLTRGTAKLRRTLGVASLAMLPAPLLGMEALERVRARVIPATAAAGAGTLIGGIGVMTTKTVVGAGLVLAIGIALIAWLIPKQHDDAPRRSTVASTPPAETARATPSALPAATVSANAPAATPSVPPPGTEADSVSTRRLEGRVLDEAGAPIAGARVYLVAANAPAIENTLRASANVVVTTDENGAFRFVDPPAGTWDLGAAVAGYCPTLAPDVSLPEGEFSMQCDVTVRRGFALTGRVLDVVGNSIEGASVLAGETGSIRGLRFFDSDETYLPGRARALRPIFSTTTAADGSFSLGGFPTDDPLPVAAWKEGFFAGRDRPRSECADAQPGRPIDLVLASFAPIRLVVRRRETNEPVRQFTPCMRPAPAPLPPDYRPSGTYAAWTGKPGDADDDG